MIELFKIIGYALGGIILGVIIGFWSRKRIVESQFDSIKNYSKKIINEAHQKAKTIKKEASLKAKDTFYQMRVEFEKDTKSFLEHNHPPLECDMILCWEDNLTQKEKDENLFAKNPNLKIVELKKIFFHYDFELRINGSPTEPASHNPKEAKNA